MEVGCKCFNKNGEVKANGATLMAIFIISVASVLCLITVSVVGVSSVKKIIKVEQKNNVTAGETYLISSFNKHEDLCGWVNYPNEDKLCQSLTLTVDPRYASYNDFTVELDIQSQAPELTNHSNFIAVFNGSLDYDAFDSKWLFHFHPGSIVNVSVCAIATVCSDINEIQYTVAIIKQSYFKAWMNGRNYKEAVYHKVLTASYSSDCQIRYNLSYTYTEEGKYYLVFVNLPKCQLRVFANATFERTEYNNKSPSPCFIKRPSLTCTKQSSSAQNALVKVGHGNTINWTQQFDFHVDCNPNKSSGPQACIVMLTFIPFLFVIIVAIICLCVHMRWLRRRGGYTRVEELPKADEQQDNHRS